MSFYDNLHLTLRKPIEKAYFEIYNTRHTFNLFKRLKFLFLCKLDILTAPHINKENDFPTLYYITEYYFKYGTNAFKSLQCCLDGIKYKFEDVETLYMQLEFLLSYFKKFEVLHFAFDYQSDCLYDEETGVIINNIKEYFKQKKKEREHNETR